MVTIWIIYTFSVYVFSYLNIFSQERCQFKTLGFWRLELACYRSIGKYTDINLRLTLKACRWEGGMSRSNIINCILQHFSCFLSTCECKLWCHLLGGGLRVFQSKRDANWLLKIWIEAIPWFKNNLKSAAAWFAHRLNWHRVLKPFDWTFVHSKNYLKKYDSMLTVGLNLKH